MGGRIRWDGFVECLPVRWASNAGMRSVAATTILFAVVACAPALGWRGHTLDAHVGGSSDALTVSVSTVRSPFRALDDLSRCYSAKATTVVTIDGRPATIVSPGGATAGPMISGIETPGHCAPMRASLQPGLEPPFVVELREGGKVRGRVRVGPGGKRRSPSWLRHPTTHTSNSTPRHAAFELPNGAFVALAEEDARYCNVAASSLEASPVMLNCMVEDPDGTAAAMAEHGAEILIPIDDRFYGHREGRVRDPFGHLWIIGKVTEELSPEEIERRMAGS